MSDDMKTSSGGETPVTESVTNHSGETAKHNFELETRELVNVPIFAAGTWTSSAGNKRKWTEEDLDEIAQNAVTLGGKVIPFLRVDHTDEDTHERITGRFKIGDLTNVRRMGSQLIADIVKIPRKAWELMKAGVFGRPSAEIFPTFKDEASGRTFKNVLSGAAILSAKHPAVTTLDDVYDLFDADGAPLAVAFEGPEKAELFQWGDNITQGGEPDMTKEEVQALVDQAVAKALEGPTKQIVELEAAVASEKSRADAAQAEIAKHEAVEFSRAYDALVAKAKGEGRVIPAQEAALKTMVEGWKVTAKDGAMEFEASGEKKSGTILEAFGAYLESLPVVVKFEEQGAQKKPEEARGGEPKVAIPQDLERYARIHGYEVDAESAEKDAKVRDVMNKRHMNYSQALSEVEGITVVVDETKAADEKSE